MANSKGLLDSPYYNKYIISNNQSYKLTSNFVFQGSLFSNGCSIHSADSDYKFSKHFVLMGLDLNKHQIKHNPAIGRFPCSTFAFTFTSPPNFYIGKNELLTPENFTSRKRLVCSGFVNLVVVYKLQDDELEEIVKFQESLTKYFQLNGEKLETDNLSLQEMPWFHILRHPDAYLPVIAPYNAVYQ